MTPTEHQIESATWQLLTSQGYVVWKFKDQARHNGKAYQKCQMQRNGVSDLCVLLSGGRVLWLEIKTLTGKQCRDQKDFQKDIEKHGGIYKIARSAKEALKIVSAHYSGHAKINP